MESKTIEMDFADRANLMSILPQNGNRIKIRLISSIMEQVEFTVQEINHWNINIMPDGRTSWNPAGGPTTKDVHFSPKEIEIISEAINEADRVGVIPFKMMKWIEKFESL